MVEYPLNGYFEFHFSTALPATGAATDADALPTWRVYEENSDTVVANGNCAKRDDANTTGYYYARGQITTAAGYEAGKEYVVRVAATVSSIAGANVVGEFAVTATRRADETLAIVRELGGVAEWPRYIADADNPGLLLAPVAGEGALVAGPCVIYTGGSYHMYYHCLGATPYRIFHATSADSFAWTRDDANNPVLSVGVAGSYDDNNIFGARVWVEGATWYMLYTARSTTYTGEKTCLATSANGLTWTKSGSNPVLAGGINPGDWDYQSAQIGDIIKIGSIYWGWYSTGSTGNTTRDRKTGAALSTNLTTWTKHSANPIFDAPYTQQYIPCVWKYRNWYYMALSQRGYGARRGGIALYRCLNPQFLPEAREFARWGLAAQQYSSNWDADALISLHIVSSDITRATFPNTALRGYYEAQSDGDSITRIGMVYAASLAQALDPTDQSQSAFAEARLVPKLKRIQDLADELSGISEWAPYVTDGANPGLIIAPTSPETGVAAPCVVKSGATYHMYYSSYGAAYLRIYHATSTDGLGAWTKDDANNPVMTYGGAGAEDDLGVWGSRVWIDGATWYMIYTARSTTYTGERIFYATSSNGITWTKQGQILVGSTLSSDWDYNSAELADVMKVGSTWYVWYNTLTGNSTADRKTGLATGTLLTALSKHSENPIFGAVEAQQYQGCVFKYRHLYYTLVTERGYGSYRGGIALYRSPNPTFLPTERQFCRWVLTNATRPDGWDTDNIDVPWVFAIDNTRVVSDTYGLRLFYQAVEARYGALGQWNIGLLYEPTCAKALDITNQALSYYVGDVLQALHGAGNWTRGGRITVQGTTTAITVENNITITHGDDVVLSFEWEDQDLTGYTFWFTVRTSKTSTGVSDSDATLQVAGVITDAAAGEFSVALTDTQTEALLVNRSYWYDVQARAATGSLTTISKGRLIVAWDTTRRTDITP